MGRPKKKPEPKQYVCVVPCWHLGRKWRKGRTATFTDDFPKDSKGNLRHFEELAPGIPPPEPEEEVVTVTGIGEG